MSYHSTDEIIFVNNHPYVHIGNNQYAAAIMGGAEAELPTDMEKVQSFIKEQVDNYVAELEAKKPVPQPVTQHTETEKERNHRQLSEIIKPVVDPDINAARFDAADAKDYIKFYTANPEASEYRDKVEKAFEALAEAGRATSRSDIL